MPALFSSIPLEFPRCLFSHLVFCWVEETAFPSSIPACRISELRMGSNCLFPWLSRSRNKKYFSDVAAITSQWPITQPRVKICKYANCAESSLVIVWVDWGNKYSRRERIDIIKMNDTYRRKGKYFHEYCSVAFECLVVNTSQRASLFCSFKVYLAVKIQTWKRLYWLYIRKIMIWDLACRSVSISIIL